ncbi:two-component sensor histidine kinase [Acinetobacter sp. ANC 4654]|uniref:heavy metal sensor histidine kinase n=1 Tax=Acinetobacter sp. ANC 4654 TaxID=1977872 RepID=UPI000A356697|nr:heavy metal sensor histidine kinase [Acinetobacter sp. ANC 4654]OTG98304.1 two-component sensor histidine kinase [Acinetobacter sp. ANC 4654]
MILKSFRSLELRLTLLVTFCSALVLCAVAFMTYLGINQILIIQQDRALAERIERLEILLQDSENIEQIIARPKLYQNMLGNLDNLFLLIHKDSILININPLDIPLPELTRQTNIQFRDLPADEYPTRIAWKTIQINNQPYLLIAGKQWSERIAILSPFRSNLLTYVLTGILGIFILCAIASRLGLSSLRKLREQTHAINIHQLQQRLNLANSPQEIEQLSSDINKMLDRIEVGYGQLNRFSEDIAHEFRTPLNNLIGQTEILLMGERSSAQYQELLISNLEDYQRLKRMINSMLFLARADRHKVLLNKQIIQIKTLIENICSIFEYQAEDQACNFVFRLKESELLADPELLQRALYNLISNSLMHGGNNRTIYIGSIKKVLNNINMIRLFVITSDIEIPTEHLDSIFERFYQCNPSRQNHHQTGGLGLSIVASIMTLHSGTYQAYNTSEGVCFELVFPQE